MSIDPGVLKRLLYFEVRVEGSDNWAFREFIDLILDMLEERFPLIINEALEPYGLDASIIENKGCQVFPEEDKCEEILVVEVYEKDGRRPLVYAGYRFNRGSNTLQIKLIGVKDAETNQKI